ncbi:hypothetical protein DL95DRAFT_471716 [Leptodontidium sp. 2 PMI_412]|nr:hypothetical protein DL95DRAFT_471716 [Leptodontidium sp. 2 PMI_412]
MKQQGNALTDMNAANWLEKFKQRNRIGGNPSRRASETNISDSGSLNPESTGHSASQTLSRISLTLQSGLPSSSPLSVTKSEEDLKSEHILAMRVEDTGIRVLRARRPCEPHDALYRWRNKFYRL